MKVYVIMQGEYSERHIVAVTLDKEKAEKLSKYHSTLDDETWVDEFETDETPDEELNSMIPAYSVTIKKDGSSEVKGYNVNAPFEPRFHIADERSMLFTAHLTASNEACALKIAQDKRAKMLAEMFGL